jgi:hypothetical protein
MKSSGRLAEFSSSLDQNPEKTPTREARVNATDEHPEGSGSVGGSSPRERSANWLRTEEGPARTYDFAPFHHSQSTDKLRRHLEPLRRRSAHLRGPELVKVPTNREASGRIGDLTSAFFLLLLLRFPSPLRSFFSVIFFWPALSITLVGSVDS